MSRHVCYPLPGCVVCLPVQKPPEHAGLMPACWSIWRVCVHVALHTAQSHLPSVLSHFPSRAASGTELSPREPERLLRSCWDGKGRPEASSVLSRRMSWTWSQGQEPGPGKKRKSQAGFLPPVAAELSLAGVTCPLNPTEKKAEVPNVGAKWLLCKSSLDQVWGPKPWPLPVPKDPLAGRTAESCL